jgi:AcrR family transcriptional regulator
MSRSTTPADTPKTEPGAQERLLEAATDIFGRHGYDAATTRMIAGEAGVNIAAIPYYFEGKEGLYRAVINHIVGMVAGRLAESREEIARQSFTGPDAKEKAVTLLEQIVARLISFMIGSPQAPRVARIILREQMYPSAAYDIIFSGFMGSALDSMATLIMTISGDISRRKATLRAMSIVGQVLAFRVARETVVRALDITGYSPEETEEIREIIMEHTRCIIDGLTHGSNRPTGKQA